MNKNQWNAAPEDVQDEEILGILGRGAGPQERAECDCQTPADCAEMGCEALADSSMKATNPKDGVGVKKWRQFAAVPLTVLCEVGVGMLEGARKYGRHNYRVSGVRASVYVDASIGHIMQWWEGEDIDPDSDLSHVTKAICSLVVVRDAMIQNMLVDDRPPKAALSGWRERMQATVDKIFARYPNPVPAYVESEPAKVPEVSDEVLAKTVKGFVGNEECQTRRAEWAKAYLKIFDANKVFDLPKNERPAFLRHLANYPAAA